MCAANICRVSSASKYRRRFREVCDMDKFLPLMKRPPGNALIEAPVAKPTPHKRLRQIGWRDASSMTQRLEMNCAGYVECAFRDGFSGPITFPLLPPHPAVTIPRFEFRKWSKPNMRLTD